MNKDTRPLIVTIQCITYNHEPYIRQCLEGFVMQKTNFRFEAIVHDDASTDGTAVIVKEYAEKYPDIIKPIFETENQYSKHDGSLSRIMDEHTHGKYVAICEGDDYWIDPLKLQKQVDFLEANPEYSMSHTGYTCYYQGLNIYEQTYNVSARNLRIAENTNNLIPFILDSNKYRIQTCSVVIRNNSKKEVNQQLAKIEGLFLMGDTQLWCFLNKVGKIHFLPEETCVYRINEGSVCRPTDVIKQKRFSLSSLEMQVYMAREMEIPNEMQQKFRKKLIREYINYLAYENEYIPCVELNLHKREKISYWIYTTRLGKKILRLRDSLLMSNKIIVLKRKIKRIPDHIYDWTNSFFMNIPIKNIRIFYLKQFVGQLGNDVYIGKGLKINRPSQIYIGNNVVINDNVRLDGRRFVHIGNNVDIATESTIWTLQHDYNNDYHQTIGGAVKVEDYCWICYRSVILPNIKIGRGAVIASCAVVTKNVDSMVVVGGIPAKMIAVRKNTLSYQLNL